MVGLNCYESKSFQFNNYVKLKGAKNRLPPNFSDNATGIIGNSM